ncbi:MAG: 4Fe-4S binding protein [Candidatus Omnitrophota bacterium]|nr:4Fe-4S binding protein [Candidatus Omnitrophota bacterium]
MAKIIINQDKCKGCFLCVNFCPKGLIKKSVKLNKQGLNFVEFSPKAGDSTDCIGCMQCAVICPDCCSEVYK